MTSIWSAIVIILYRYIGTVRVYIHFLFLFTVGPCEPLTNSSNIHIEIVRPGRHANVTHSHGTLLKVSCDHGYQPNVVNGTAKCWRTRWKPAKPDCKLSKLN